MNEIKIYKSPKKAIKILLVALTFVLLTLWDLLSRKLRIPIIIDWILLGMFGTGVITSLYDLLDKKPQIIINETGIQDKSAYRDVINWNIIEHAYWNVIHRQPFVCIIVKDEYKHLIKANGRLTSVSLKMGMEEININLSNISSIDEQTLTSYIIALSNAKPAERDHLLKLQSTNFINNTTHEHTT